MTLVKGRGRLEGPGGGVQGKAGGANVLKEWLTKGLEVFDGHRQRRTAQKASH